MSKELGDSSSFEDVSSEGSREGELVSEQQKAKADFLHLLKYAEDASHARKIRDDFHLEDEVTGPATREAFIKRLEHGDAKGAFSIKDFFAIPAEVLASPEVQNAARTGLLELLTHPEPKYIPPPGSGFGGEPSTYDFTSATRIRDFFALSKDVVDDIAKSALLRHLRLNPTEAVKMKEVFGVSDEVINSPEVQAAAKAALIDEEDFRIKDAFLSDDVLTSPEVQTAAKGWIVSELHSTPLRFGIERALRIQKLFRLSEDSVQDAAREAIAYQMVHDHSDFVERILQIKETFHLPDLMVQKIVMDQIERRGIITKKLLQRAQEAKKAFHIPDLVFLDIVKKELINTLDRGDGTGALFIKKSFTFPIGFTTSPEVQSAAKKCILKRSTNFKGSSWALKEAQEIKQIFLTS